MHFHRDLMLTKVKERATASPTTTLLRRPEFAGDTKAGGACGAGSQRSSASHWDMNLARKYYCCDSIIGAASLAGSSMCGVLVYHNS